MIVLVLSNFFWVASALNTLWLVELQKEFFVSLLEAPFLQGQKCNTYYAVPAEGAEIWGRAYN